MAVRGTYVRKGIVKLVPVSFHWVFLKYFIQIYALIKSGPWIHYEEVRTNVNLLHALDEPENLITSLTSQRSEQNRNVNSTGYINVLETHYLKLFDNYIKCIWALETIQLCTGFVFIWPCNQCEGCMHSGMTLQLLNCDYHSFWHKEKHKKGLQSQ
jgi:hypothetical protein